MNNATKSRKQDSDKTSKPYYIKQTKIEFGQHTIKMSYDVVIISIKDRQEILLFFYVVDMRKGRGKTTEVYHYSKWITVV